MVAVPSFDLPAADAKQAWIDQELAKLTPEERAQYESSSFFRGIVDLTLEQEWENPGCFERVAAAREMYGDDSERELADLETGRHPFQQPR
ncbi:MAG: hypothetical protein QM820_51810 [Minicystis sp.]